MLHLVFSKWRLVLLGSWIIEYNAAASSTTKQAKAKQRSSSQLQSDKSSVSAWHQPHPIAGLGKGGAPSSSFGRRCIKDSAHEELFLLLAKSMSKQHLKNHSIIRNFKFINTLHWSFFLFSKKHCLDYIYVSGCFCSN